MVARNLVAGIGTMQRATAARRIAARRPENRVRPIPVIETMPQSLAGSVDLERRLGIAIS
jgi:hypothetical protein